MLLLDHQEQDNLSRTIEPSPVYFSVNRVKKIKPWHFHASSILLLLSGYSGDALSEPFAERMEDCKNMEASEPSDKVLECYNKLTDERVAIRKQHGLLSRHNRGLAFEWRPVQTPFLIYKQNYLLFFTKTDHPNYDPTTPDINTHIPIYNHKLDNRDVKFQISFKAHLLGEGRNTFWLGYTQLSFWQFYDRKHSMPFRETNYEPELIYSYSPEDQPNEENRIYTRFLNFSLVHQSDGQSLPGSRGWNRFYSQTGLELNLGNDKRLEILPRVWVILPRGTPDIADYLGHGDIEVRYRFGQGALIAIAKVHSIQYDLSYPLTKLFGEEILDTNLHLQYFNGYGESLVDYNQAHRTLGIGISFPFE